MRDRAWRKYKQDCKVIKRLKYRLHYHYHTDDNDIMFQYYSVRNLLGSSTHHMYKTYTSCRSDSRYKTKYSPNKASSYYRDSNKKGKRETDKILFINLMKEIC